MMKQVFDSIEASEISAPFQIAELFRPANPGRDFAPSTEWAVIADVQGDESTWNVIVEAGPTQAGPWKRIDAANHLGPARIRLGGLTWFRLRASRFDKPGDNSTLSAWAG